MPASPHELVFDPPSKDCKFNRGNPGERYGRGREEKGIDYFLYINEHQLGIPSD